MFYKYEIACRQAGLSEEKTAEIRRMFNAQFRDCTEKEKPGKDRFMNSGIQKIFMGEMEIMVPMSLRFLL